MWLVEYFTRILEAEHYFMRNITLFYTEIQRFFAGFFVFYPWPSIYIKCKRNRMYTIILRNNSTNEVAVYNNMQDVAMGRLYLEFRNVDIDVPDGEYTYAVFTNNRNDVTYEFKADILDTIIHTEDGDCELRDINPRVGLMRVGIVSAVNTYDNNKNETYYYEG